MFDNPFSMVVAIVLITAIAGVLRAKYKAEQGIVEDGNGEPRRLVDPDAGRMREEIKQLKDRIAVLERIATDKSNRLEDEIEALRDKTHS
ncbi:hypothetical protein [Parasphingopyxis lamellibrachiae]|uniref:Phage shock protein B n=1 Tax=Parasphingopyxis lamellibrachiae TaxID=680125 RepID=A0A3D9FEH6_9SPHN|nr:hypothetical protein [Parasphingopyxis lamellibrachiae]RED15456.1 hypothetical protein DFR46_0450 [Parasphingopyxis lamellibrachiae]